MEGLFLPKPQKSESFSGETQRIHRIQAELLDLMLERAESSADPELTREAVIEQLRSVGDDLPSAQALLDVELLYHQEPVRNKYGFDIRHGV